MCDAKRFRVVAIYFSHQAESAGLCVNPASENGSELDWTLNGFQVNISTDPNWVGSYQRQLDSTLRMMYRISWKLSWMDWIAYVRFYPTKSLTTTPTLWLAKVLSRRSPTTFPLLASLLSSITTSRLTALRIVQFYFLVVADICQEVTKQIWHEPIQSVEQVIQIELFVPCATAHSIVNFSRCC